MFSVGRNDAAEEEEKRSDPRKTREEVRRRKDLVQQARSRHLKVGSESSTEIQRMLSKDKRTQPRMKDILLRQNEKQKKKKKDVNEEEKEEKKEAEEEKEEVIASREGGAMAKPKKAKPNISDTMVEPMERREEQRLKPGEEGGGSIPNHTFPNPVSIMPKAKKKGEINQEGLGRCSLLGVGKRNLGPIPNNVKPNQSLEEASGEGVPPV